MTLFFVFIIGVNIGVIIKFYIGTFFLNREINNIINNIVDGTYSRYKNETDEQFKERLTYLIKGEL